MHLRLTIIFMASLVLAFADETGFKPLFNGHSMEGWTAARGTGSGDWGAFSVNKEEKAIQTYAGREADSKQNFDCLVTDTSYSRFILKLEYKWLDKRFAPRADWDRDAGLLFHIHGNLKKVWPLSLEMQIGETPGDSNQKKRFHTGDLFVLSNDAQTSTPNNKKWYEPDAPKSLGKNIRTRLGVEKPRGEWNEIEIRVDGSKKATFILNGEVVLETFDFTNKTASGEVTPLASGHIGLQAEWAEILYRNIRIKELTSE